MITIVIIIIVIFGLWGALNFYFEFFYIIPCMKLSIRQFKIDNTYIFWKKSFNIVYPVKYILIYVIIKKDGIDDIIGVKKIENGIEEEYLTWYFCNSFDCEHIFRRKYSESIIKELRNPLVILKYLMI